MNFLLLGALLSIVINLAMLFLIAYGVATPAYMGEAVFMHLLGFAAPSAALPVLLEL